MTHFHRLRVAEVRRETDDAVSVRFELPPQLKDEFRYRQGQHLTLRHTFGGQEQRRNYSICSSVRERALRIAIRRIPGGVFSNFANDRLQAGDHLDVLPPSGRFHTALDPAQRKHYLAFAAGCGITPIYSLLKTALETEPASRCTLVYGNRTTHSILFLEEVEDLKDRYPTRFSLIHTLSRESQDIDLFSGRIDAAKVEALCDTLIPIGRIDECFICGPRGMIEAVKAALQARGFDPVHIHFELFTPPGVSAHSLDHAHEARQLSAEEATKLCEVSVILDGRRTTLQLQRGAEPILDAALKLRPDLPFACKGGMCCTCRAKVLEGEVAMDACYGLEDDEIQAGFVLTCQAHPVSAKVVVDYDQR
jgi:ring-1,2-phenylacetyl-CoA epoxidase subunit PaaE